MESPQRTSYRNTQGESAILSDLLRNLGDKPSSEAVQEKAAPQPVEKLKQSIEEDIVIVGELFSTYILVQQGEGIWLIDKHAAHERIVFNQLSAQGEQAEGQMLLTPIQVVLSPQEKAACIQGFDTLEQSGFEIDDIGGQALILRRIPIYLDESDACATLTEIARRMLLPGGAGNSILDELYTSIACKAAIRAGKSSDLRELESLARRVLSQAGLRSCPHGRPVAVYTSRRELEKRFKRVL